MSKKSSSHKRKNNIKSIGEIVNEKENLRFSSHKGISLAIETVVVLILAAIVLAAVIFLFMGAGGSGGTEMSARLDQSKWCTAYVQIDPECKSAEVDVTIKKGLAKACSQLKYPSCTEGTDASYECMLRCCGNYCAGESCKTDTDCEYCDPQKKKVYYNKCINGVCNMGAFGSGPLRDC